MISRNHYAFGRSLQRFCYADGETYFSYQPLNIQAYHFCTKGGFVKIYNESADVQMNPMNTGDWYDPEHFSTFNGKMQRTAKGETVIWVIDKNLNANYLPECEKWFLPKGESTVLPLKTKLFLCEGNLGFDGKNFFTNVTTQISVKKEVLNVTANTDCYGILFI